MDRVIVGGLLILGMGFGLSAQACTTDGWLGGKSGIPDNGDVGSPLTVSRVSELCALAITDTSWVQSNAASNTKYIGRFYVYPNLSGSGTVDLLVAYSDEGGADVDTLFKVSYDGTDFIFDARGADGDFESATASSGWNLIEFEYDSGSNTFNYWVNEAWDFDSLSYEAVTGSFASGTGTVEAVKLGAPNGMDGSTGTITFDAFEAHRTKSVGALLAGDSNFSGSINVFDMVSQQNEILGNALAPGQPDCNLNGSVNVFDLVCVQNKILGN